MTNRKNTRRALVLSLLSLLLCCSMLVGTTFAWFTDSVTSGNNKIVAGNLDIELDYALLNEDGTVKEWKTVNNTTELFTGNLWEPGHTEVVYLKMSNLGTLALKYNLGINIVSETTGTNVANESFKLSDFIYMGVVENAEPAYTSRENAVKAAQQGINGIISTGYTKTGKMIAGADALYLAVVVYMPETVDNKANYKTGTTRPEIDLGINLFATQVEQEMDSFDINYDKSVAVFTVADANALLAENKDAYLINCNEPDGILYVPANYTGTLILDNVKIASVQETAAVSTTSLTDGEPITAPAADGIKIGIAGNVAVKATEEGMSAITGTKLNIFGSGKLTAIGKGKAAFGIGGMTTEAITITGVTIDYVEGGCAYGVGTDENYYKDAPEGGAAIGSGKDDAVITLNKVEVTKAVGGSKAAAIGARYHVGVTVNITDSTIAYAEGGVSAAAIGGSRVSKGAAESGTTINITNSKITAKGGAYGAGIGSGYDTHCQAKQPMTTVNITGSTINAQGGKYAAGVGGGYHNGALNGEIKDSTVKATSGEKVYKSSYTAAMDIGFGVTDPTREGQQTESKLIYNGVEITIGTAPKAAMTNEDVANALNAGAKEICLSAGTYSLPSLNGKEGVTIVGAKGTVIGGEGTSTGFGGNFGKNNTYKNLTFSGSSNGTRWTNGQGGNVTFENCEFLGGNTYGFHVDQSNGATFTFNNCTFAGFNAFAGDLVHLYFNNCTFKSNSRYNGLNLYCTTTVTDCTFEYIAGKSNFIDMEGTGKTLTIENCTATLDGEAADVESFVGGSKLAQNTVVVK